MNISIFGIIELKPYKLGFETIKTVRLIVDSERFYILKGLKTDLGSIPKPLRIIFPRYGLETTGYVIHDYGYRVQPKNTNRKFWDNVLLQILKDQGIKYYKRYSIYWGLRSFGWVAWNKNKKQLGR
ncbi:DUF1353 domain-containing protein [Psychrilyobacter atlanticus]|uniref:DUF1353 domain-containing protein n=1 Tax=Psychrilyobacter atlanticus TaxID=271091 RepID=UPI00040E2DCC|nr:DUF1353 domain-containing protein [Psychrilyobacter atlanticus]